MRRKLTWQGLLCLSLACVVLVPACVRASSSSVVAVSEQVQESKEVLEEGRLPPENNQEMEAVGTEDVAAEMMERILYGLPEPDARLPDAAGRLKLTDEEYKALLEKVWKQRQEELKKAMEAMEDYGSIIRNRTALLMNLTLVDTSSSGDGTVQQKIDTLNDLEWMVQDIDHATHFISLGGAELCVHLFDDESQEVRMLAAHTIGNAVKNLPDLQKRALKAGVITRALDKLNELFPCQAGSTSDSDECSKYLYAVSSTVRGHAESQDEAIRAGVLQMLIKFLKVNEMEEKLLRKVLALVSDSFREWEGCHAEWAVNGTDSELCESLESRAQQYLLALEGKTTEYVSPVVVQSLLLTMSAAGCPSDALQNALNRAHKDLD